MKSAGSSLAFGLTLLLLTTFLATAQNPGGKKEKKSTRQDAAQNKELRPNLAIGGPGVRFPSYDPRHPPGKDVNEPFQLSQEYPDIYDPQETFPWESIDYTKDPASYLQAVLKYCLEGNVEVDFRVHKNKVRKWYHAPWLHDDGDPAGAGREYHRGLTRERRSRPFELHTLQKNIAQNWAVGMFNDRGAYTLGQVWDTSEEYPDPARHNFPDHTVCFKLLFTNAPVKEVPFLEGTLEWTANIYKDTNKYAPPRVDGIVRLLQIDVAVKEPRAAARSGWVFGTFVYDGAAEGKAVWDRMSYVGLAWGDDDGAKDDLNKGGAFVNPKLKESLLNAALVEKPGHDYGRKAYLRHLGLGGRLNGPVDNPVSSCISCHGRAATFAKALPFSKKSGLPMETVFLKSSDPAQYPPEEFSRFFRTLRPGSHLELDAGDLFVTTDYSLQIPAGVRNFYQHLRAKQEIVKRLADRGASDLTPAALQNLQPLPKVERAGTKPN